MERFNRSSTGLSRAQGVHWRDPRGLYEGRAECEVTEQATRTTIDSFNEVFNRQDADALAALLTDDTVFEDTSPAPDGRRIEGKAAVVEFCDGWRVIPTRDSRAKNSS